MYIELLKPGLAHTYIKVSACIDRWYGIVEMYRIKHEEAGITDCREE